MWRVVVSFLAVSFGLPPVMLVAAGASPRLLFPLIAPYAAAAAYLDSVSVSAVLALIQAPVYGCFIALLFPLRRNLRPLCALLAVHLVVAVVAISIGWPPSQTITNVSVPQTITLSGRALHGGVDHVSVHVYGTIDGSATIHLNGGNSPVLVSGTVDWRFSGDFYEHAAVIVYTPTGVTKGTITFKADFD